MHNILLRSNYPTFVILDAPCSSKVLDGLSKEGSGSKFGSFEILSLQNTGRVHFTTDLCEALRSRYQVRFTMAELIQSMPKRPDQYATPELTPRQNTSPILIQAIAPGVVGLTTRLPYAVIITDT